MKLRLSTIIAFIPLCYLACTGSYSETGSPKEGSNIRLNYFFAENFALSPDNKYMATTSFGGFGEIHIVDLENGRVTEELKGSLTGYGEKLPLFVSGQIARFSYSGDGERLFIYSNQNDGSSLLTVFDISTRSEIRTFKSGNARPLQVSSSEKLVLSQRDDGILELHDFENGGIVKSLSPPPEFHACEKIMITPDDQYLVAFSEEGVVYFLSLSTEKLEMVSVPGGRYGQYDLEYLEFSESGQYFFTYGKKELLIWETVRRKVIHTVPFRGKELDESIKGQPLKWSGDRYIGGMGDEDGTATLFCIDAQKGEFAWSIAPSNPDANLALPLIIINDFELSSDGTKIYFTQQFNSDIWIAESEKCYPVARNRTDYSLMYYSAFTSGANELYVAFANGDIHRWDLYRGIYMGIFKKVNLSISAISVSSDDSRLIVKGMKEMGSMPEEFELSNLGSLEDIDEFLSYEYDLKTGAELSKKATPEHSSNSSSEGGVQSPKGYLSFQEFQGRYTLFSNPLNKVLHMATLRGGERDFVVFAGDGRFDGTERGIKELLHAVDEGQMVDIEEYRDQYYTPGLLREFAFPEQKERPASPPVITVGSPADRRYPVTIANEHGGIGRVEIYAGSRLIEEDARALSPKPLAEVATVAFSLDLSKYMLDPSADHVIRILAFDEGNNVNTEDNSIRIRGSQVSVE